MNKFYKVTLGNSSKVASSAEEAMTIADEMVAAAGGGIPTIKECDQQGNPITQSPAVVSTSAPKTPPPVNPPTKTVETPKPTPVYSNWNNPVVDNKAKERIEKLHASVAQAGGPKIDTKQQFFATGTRMAREGYDSQRKREQEYQKQMPLTNAIEELQEKVGNEVRRDYKMSAKDIADMLTVEDNQLYVKDHLLTERAIRGIIGRLESPALGYVLGLQERVSGESLLAAADHEVISRDVEMMAETLRYECLRRGDTEFKLRMREYPCDVYAALSPTFGVADAPMVMEQILEQMPDDARGSWEYDQDTTRWELKASIWTPIPVDEQAVGEPFEGYVSLSSHDNGTGSFNGGGGINLLRCLNASTYSAGDAELRRTHRGDKMLFDVKDMITKSLKAISALCQAWGKGRKDKVEIPAGLTLEQAMPGFWRSLLKEGELVGVLTGRKENHIKGLTQAYYDERRDHERLVRADFGQAWTRYIQDQPLQVRREGELAIGSWMVKPPRTIRCDMKE